MEFAGPSNIGTETLGHGPTSALDSRRNILGVNDTDDKGTGDMSHAQRYSPEILDKDTRRWLERTGYYDRGRHAAIAEAWKQLDIFNENAEKEIG